MTQRYYFIVKFLLEDVDAGLLAGRCISTLHGFINNNLTGKNQVGVSFPLWSDDTLGNAVAFVADDKELLIGLSFQPYFSLMKSEELFDLSPVVPVPTDLPEIRFVRNQTIGKSFLGSKRRRMKRAQSRAETMGKLITPQPNEEREFELFHRVPLTSKSTGEEMMLHVQKQSNVEVVDTNFNAYGLATNQAWKGTVPDLKNAML
ncbi:type I-F CRISPR-associated endoribonuclease Cas6/Csy4 [Vibrio algicola]|uniref:Type I-F CRISPR-associated endoribonuclease Cas6/Csy4 n=1 Tax=Vibrio algicola TaxID=2662262 RepID=A0A5Q0TEX5_9VIBR|nr:type I-F CRISPR-associated endoribonuclease Cas6/Csy4 [Vibrio algicola]